ncbi:MAG TPA: hypothetical protein VHO46_05330 [Bacteroidales bacterium]|nr:hypothetical protein [Bacteroidales bacterium]
MVKKIIYAVVSLAIIACGVYASTRLNYFERSVRIFNMNQEQAFRGGPEGGFSGREAFHGNFDRRGPEPNTNIPDSLRTQFRDRGGERRTNAAFAGGQFHGRGDFNRGSKINMRNVILFLSVFATSTIIVIYIDKLYSFLRKRKRKRNESIDRIIA